MPLVVAIDEAIVAEESSVNLHTVVASEGLLVLAVGNALGAERTSRWRSNWVLPGCERKLGLFQAALLQHLLE